MESVSSDDEEAKFLVGVPSVAIQKIMVPIYGAPYALKTASVTFELSTGEIKITKKSSDGILLQGASFELLGNAGSVLATATTGTNGIAVFADLMPGAYTVREKNAPQGYALAASSSQSVTVAAGMTTNVAFVNDRVMGRIRIVKTDQLTGKPLSGAVFSITRLSGPVSDNASDVGKVVATVTTNAQGIAETGLLPWGEYKVVETGVRTAILIPAMPQPFGSNDERGTIHELDEENVPSVYGSTPADDALHVLLCYGCRKSGYGHAECDQYPGARRCASFENRLAAGSLQG